MPDIIHLLPDSVANQIAAGEVIQRPASLIKELVENAIDAGATRIQVIVTDAGKSCVQVIDNGKGMTETDARLSFERHATSKITKADDLFSLTTMGFRGEALASIAAVSQVELRTRTPDSELGVCLQIEGSKVLLQEPIVCPVGANFLIKNLFFNIPARRKFLKSNHTELSNIVAEFERIALAHPALSFALSRPVISVSASSIFSGARWTNISCRCMWKRTWSRSLASWGIPKAARKKGRSNSFLPMAASCDTRISQKRYKVPTNASFPTANKYRSFCKSSSIPVVLTSISIRPKQKSNLRTNNPSGKY